MSLVLQVFGHKLKYWTGLIFYQLMVQNEKLKNKVLHRFNIAHTNYSDL